VSAVALRLDSEDFPTRSRLGLSVERKLSNTYAESTQIYARRTWGVRLSPEEKWKNSGGTTRGIHALVDFAAYFMNLSMALRPQRIKKDQGR